MPTLAVRQDPSSTTTSNTSTETAPIYNTNPGGGSTTLYLFTFLITILVLGLISSGLLIRAYILRRRFHRRVEEALRRGEALPPDAAAALGLIPRRPNARNKKEKNHGLMPTMWESEMWRDDEKAGLEDVSDERDGDGGGEGVVDKEGWDELTPLSILHYTTSDPTISTTVQPPINMPPPLTPGSYFRSLWSSRGLTTITNTTNTSQRPGLTHRPTSMLIPTQKPVFSVPDVGEDVVVGVMIAMPCQGAMEDRWNITKNQDDEGEEMGRELPDVCLGVLGTRLKD
ncbi:hypothetical protein I203_101397 [Kwoniella mangroviensis CBS 8507]|uniref:uncharacterized protein n=1 Tax=Kwoniella mangroviensis CBS 8507 TaxID=1296122 RepID=UPI00080D3EEA|nr:uncharacterized protein I203_05451 [Kwoniella mangroviensis CBS 8507]OCF65206.1 hypothetical protein I203_05451 [Kwoniella mangroviensis CBS 8507]